MRAPLLKLLALALAAFIGAALLGSTGGSLRLQYCRNPDCQQLVNCTDKWGQEVRCSNGHRYRCPPSPTQPGGN